MTMKKTNTLLLLLVAGAWMVSCGGGGSGRMPTAAVTPPASMPPAASDPPPPPTTTTTLAAEPAPQPTPQYCPPLTKVTSRLYKVLDVSGRQIDTPVVGGKVVIDATPRFDGQACNLEHNNCGGRDCEDPRGADWTLVEGKSRAKSNGYQFIIGPLVEGTHIWRVCPLPDVMDGQEDPVQVIGDDPCSEGGFDVK